ncbi:hypothetical protein [Sphingobium phenoxybenzoativorans]|nr:hypothetical protein [Sphingobium phenoxybenzoativorans]
MAKFAFAVAALIALAGCRQEPRLTGPNDGENATIGAVDNSAQP